MLVSAMMCAPWSTPDISDGDSVSPPCANTTWPPLARSALTTAARRAKPPRRRAVRHQRLAHLIDVVGQDEGDLCAVRPGPPLRHDDRGGEAKRDGAAAKLNHSGSVRAVALARIGQRPAMLARCGMTTMNRPESIATHWPYAAGRARRPDRRADRQSRHAGRHRRRFGAALSAGISQRRPGDREPGPGLEVRAQRHHSAPPAARQRPRLRENLESRAKRIAAEDHHPRAGGEASRARSTRSIPPSWSTGRCATAIRRWRPGIEALAKAGCERILLLPLYPQYAAATSATVCDIAFRDADQAARPAGAARRAAVLRRSGLYRGAGELDRGRAQAAAVQARADPRLVPRHPEILRRRRRSLSAAIARRRCGCCASG